MKKRQQGENVITSSQTGIATVTDRLPLEVEGLELLSDEGLNELGQQVEQEVLRRRIRLQEVKQ
ncbi:MAG TPA: hypothetical protein VMR62_01690 [Bryobacteraceae bacterium]|jgi:hypothetical protein|nr:hypothetical protein [Bryobacteraceae bacterium]